jgi:DNA polymerase-1
MSEDPGLIAATQAEVDIHTYSARLMYGDPTIQKSDARRAKAKNGRYCRIYGGGAAKLADTIEGPLAEAQEFMENDDRAFPGIRRLMNEVSNTALARLATEGRAYVLSAGGRRLTAPGDKVYKLVNYRIQGGCADVFKEKLVELDAAGFEENMLLPVHDEELFRFRRGDTEGPREAARIMEDRTTFSVPLTVELSGPYERWGNKYGDR